MKQSITRTQAAIEKTLHFAFYFTASLIFGATTSGSILGVLGYYRRVPVIILTVVLTALVSWILFRAERNNRLPISSKLKDPSSYDIAIYAIALAIILTLILLPAARWPQSIAGDWFPWDAGKYHFPKVIEMVRSGSANDLSIAYGEYPFGYESLLAFSILIAGDASLFGWIHVIIDVFFILSFWLLACRYTGLNKSILLFLVAVVILSESLFVTFNLWQVFRLEVVTIGKNDLLLAGTIISFLGFYPYPSGDKNNLSLVPAALMGCAALSVKPNAAYILGPLWFILGLVMLLSKRTQAEENTVPIFSRYLAVSMIMVPGLVWLVRNLVILRTFFSEYVLVAAEWSIAANINNPYFYEYIPKNLILMIGLAIGLAAIAIKLRPGYRWQAGIFILLIIGFAFTPVSAFFIDTDVPAEVNWRFGQAMLVYASLAILMIVDTAIGLIGKKYPIELPNMPIALAVTVFLAIVLFVSNKEALEKKQENAYVLHDQFSQPVGVDGYYSAYDYVQKNVHDSVVWVENGLPFYAYDPGYTNTVSRKAGSADYIIQIKTDWFGDGREALPAYFHPKRWEEYYSIVYEDPEGVVFKRKQ